MEEKKCVGIRKLTLFAAYMLSYMCMQSMMVERALPETEGANTRLVLYILQQLAVMTGFIIPSIGGIYNMLNKRKGRVLLFICQSICFFSLYVDVSIPLQEALIVLSSLSIGATGAVVYASIALVTDFDDNMGRKSIGYAIGLGGALSLIVQMLLMAVPSAGKVFVTLILISDYAYVLYEISIPQATSVALEKRVWKKKTVCLCISVCSVLLILAYYESYINVSNFGGHFYEYVRLFVIAGYVIIGAAFGSARRWVTTLILVCISMIAVIANYLMLNLGDEWWIHTALFYVVLGSVVAYYNLKFMEISVRTSSPILWASMGRILDAGVTATLTACVPLIPNGNVSVLVMYMVLLALLIAASVAGGFLSVGNSAAVLAEEHAALMEKEQMEWGEKKKVLSEQYNLTPREEEVFEMLVTTEYKNQEMADRLYISRRQLQNHIASIYQKTGATSRPGLLLMINSDI